MDRNKRKHIFFCVPNYGLHSRKQTWQWKNPIFNGEYIFKRSIFHCHATLPKGMYNGDPGYTPFFHHMKTHFSPEFPDETFHHNIISQIPNSTSGSKDFKQIPNSNHFDRKDETPPAVFSRPFTPSRSCKEVEVFFFTQGISGQH